MSVVTRAWGRWTGRRRELAERQLEAGNIDDGTDLMQRTDGITGDYYAGRRALGRLLNPKAKTRTEWRGD